MQVHEAVLPTKRSDGDRSSALEGIATRLDSGNYADAEAESVSDISTTLAGEHHIGSAIPELATSEIITEQIAHFARAGFNFFKGSQAFSTRSLADRRAAGGNGAIRPPNLQAPIPQPRKRLWRGHFVNQLKIDVEHRRAAFFGHYNVVIPDFFKKCLWHGKIL